MLIPSWSANGIFSSSGEREDGPDDGRNASKDGLRKRKRRCGPNSTNGNSRSNIKKFMSDEIRQCDVCARALLWTPSLEQDHFSPKNPASWPKKSNAENLPRFIERHISCTSPLPCSFCVGGQVGINQWCGSLYCSRECQMQGEGAVTAKTQNYNANARASVTSDSSSFLPLPKILPPKLFFCKHRFSNGIDIESKEPEQKEVSDLIEEAADSMSAIEKRFQKICGYNDRGSATTMHMIGAEECALLLATIISCTTPAWIRGELSCTTGKNFLSLSQQMNSGEESLVEEMWAMSRSHHSLRVLLQKFNDMSKNHDEDNGHATTTDTTFPPYPEFLQCYLDIKRSCLSRVNAPTHPLVSYATKTIISPHDLTESERDTALDLLKCSWLSPKSIDSKTQCAANITSAISAESSNNSRDIQSTILRWRKAAHFAHYVSNPTATSDAESTQIQALLQKSYFVYSPSMFRQNSHSCSPTMALTIPETVQKEDSKEQQSPLERLAWLALHDIPKGESAISILDSLEGDVNSRSTELRRMLGQKCVCSCIRCMYELSLKGDEETGVSNDKLQLDQCQLKRLADLAMQQGRFDDATTLYNSILQMHPHDGDVLHARAASYLGRASSISYKDQGHCQGHFLEAQRLWKKAGSIQECENHPEISTQVAKQRVYKTNECEESVAGINKEVIQTSNIGSIAFVSHLDGECFTTSNQTPVLTKKECQDAINSAEQHASKGENGGWTTSRHYAVPTTDIPLHELTDLHPWFHQLWQKTIRPLLRRQFVLVSPPASLAGARNSYRDIFLHDVFLVRYDAARQRYLPPHYDESTHSFIIALNDNFKGGGTYIHALDKTLAPAVGGMMSFCGGELLHSGDPVVEGTRYIIAAFCYVDLVGGSNDTAGLSRQTLSEGEKSQQLQTQSKLKGIFDNDGSNSDRAVKCAKEKSQSPFSFGFSIN